jgi:myo-inositol-1(or 4)-monophosphatase
LDGTVNFVAGLPCYGIAVVLIQNDAPVLAAVFDVPNQTMYSAIAGQGAFVDAAPLVRTDHAASLAIVSSGLLADLASNAPDALAGLLQKFKLRNFGSQALHLCYAAAGRVSLVASKEAKGWDDMAGALIAREAGLTFGHYGATPTALDQNQYSLCAASDIFTTLAPAFARSIARDGVTTKD